MGEYRISDFRNVKADAGIGRLGDECHFNDSSMIEKDNFSFRAKLYRDHSLRLHERTIRNELSPSSPPFTSQSPLAITVEISGLC